MNMSPLLLAKLSFGIAIAYREQARIELARTRRARACERWDEAGLHLGAAMFCRGNADTWARFARMVLRARMVQRA